MEPPERMRRSDPEADWKRVAMVGAATVITVVLMIVVVEQIARQAVLVTSLAASTFLLYYQPLHRMIRKPARAATVTVIATAGAKVPPGMNLSERNPTPAAIRCPPTSRCIG